MGEFKLTAGVMPEETRSGQRKSAYRDALREAKSLFESDAETTAIHVENGGKDLRSMYLSFRNHIKEPEFYGVLSVHTINSQLWIRRVAAKDVEEG